EGLDEAVTGLEAGGSATFTAELKDGPAKGQQAEITVTVENVSEREVPELDDEFAQLASEFDTLEELREDSRKRLTDQKKYQQVTEVQEKGLEARLERTEIPMPEKLPADEIETRKHNLVHHQLGQIGMDLNAYLKMRDQSSEECEAELKEQAEKGIRTQFVL